MARERRKRHYLLCWNCAKEFRAARCTATYCCARCRQAGHRRKEAGLHPQTPAYQRMKFGYVHTPDPK